jgi:hypothetical protein
MFSPSQLLCNAEIGVGPPRFVVAAAFIPNLGVIPEQGELKKCVVET